MVVFEEGAVVLHPCTGMGDFVFDKFTTVINAEVANDDVGLPFEGGAVFFGVPEAATFKATP